MATPTQPEIERRVVPSSCEIRADGDSPPRLVGHAALFDNETEIFPGLTERIAAGAFTRALEEKQDVRALVDHDPSKVIGRTKSLTLTLKEDRKGLLVDITPPDTTVGNDIVISVRRGDVDQMSFSFIARKEEWEDFEDGTSRRTIEDVDLFDVSPVTFPAYPDTDIAVRSLKEHRQSLAPGKAEELGKSFGEYRDKQREEAGLKPPVTADTRARMADIEAEAEKHAALVEKMSADSTD